MQIIYRAIFTVAFSVHADRDKFQSDLNTQVLSLIQSGDYKSHIIPQASTPQMGNVWDLTPDTEVGYQYFDAQANAVWVARAIVGFSDPAERDLFFAVLQDQYRVVLTTTAKVGGVFQTDILPVREAIDLVSVSI